MVGDSICVLQEVGEICGRYSHGFSDFERTNATSSPGERFSALCVYTSSIFPTAYSLLSLLWACVWSLERDRNVDRSHVAQEQSWTIMRHFCVFLDLGASSRMASENPIQNQISKRCRRIGS